MEHNFVLFWGIVVLFLYTRYGSQFGLPNIFEGFGASRNINPYYSLTEMMKPDGMAQVQRNNNLVACHTATQHLNPYAANDAHNKSNCGYLGHIKSDFVEPFDPRYKGAAIQKSRLTSAFEKTFPTRRKNNEMFFLKKRKERFDSVSLNAGTVSNDKDYPNGGGRTADLMNAQNYNVPVTRIGFSRYDEKPTEIISNYNNYTNGYSSFPSGTMSEKFLGGDSQINVVNERPTLMEYQLGKQYMFGSGDKYLKNRENGVENLYAGDSVDTVTNTRPVLFEHELNGIRRANPLNLKKGSQLMNAPTLEGMGASRELNKGYDKDGLSLRLINTSNFESFRNGSSGPLTRKRLISHLPNNLRETMIREGYPLNAQDANVSNRLLLSSPTGRTNSLAVDASANNSLSYSQNESMTTTDSKIKTGSALHDSAFAYANMMKV
jgi:hypothetical protein